MYQLSTYNRVKELESPFIKRVFYAIYCIAFAMIIANSFIFVYWPSFIPQYYLVISSILSVSIVFITYRYDHYRKHSCQFCGNQLAEVTVPLVLTHKFLKMNGLKDGDAFYTQRSLLRYRLIKRWIKISKLSLACHHCRLTEKRSYENIEKVSTLEINLVKNKYQNSLVQR